MALHDRFPSYFYKRGNLFNTYLGYTEGVLPSDRPIDRKRHRSKGRPVSAAGAKNRPTAASFTPDQDVTEFVAFARANLSLIEGQLLFETIAEKFNVPVEVPRDARLWSGLRYLMTKHTPKGTGAMYLAALEDRKSREVPLIDLER
jgi:hypothetical protein